jgi:hypothetical protein
MNRTAVQAGEHDTVAFDSSPEHDDWKRPEKINSDIGERRKVPETDVNMLRYHKVLAERVKLAIVLHFVTRNRNVSHAKAMNDK